MKHNDFKLAFGRIFVILLFLLTFCICCGSEQKNAAEKNADVPKLQTQWWVIEADRMVTNQIERRGVRDAKVLRTMRDIPRHLFVPGYLKNSAYSDRPLPIGEGQTISQPYIVALMTELLQLEGGETILEIGTGSGYQAAVLSPLVKKVFTIEIVKPLANSARKLIEKLGYENVIVKWGDGYKGWIEHAPYDRVIVTAAPDKVPQALIDQMKIGGLLVIPVGTYYQELKVITKISEQEIEEKSIIPVRFVPMVHSESVITDTNLKINR